MIREILKQTNWVDVFVLILLFRAGYIAVRSGFFAELFKFCGVISAAYLSLHYYVILSVFIQARFLGEQKFADILELISFIALALSGYGVFVLLRLLFSRLIKAEAAQDLHKWGGFAVGLVKGFLFISLLTFMLVISNVSYFKQSIKYSYLGSRIFQVAPAAYGFIWTKVASKFMTQEQANNAVLILQNEIVKK